MTNAAAVGWGGDRYHLYKSDRGSVVVLATLWDSAKDAECGRPGAPDCRDCVVLRLR